APRGPRAAGLLVGQVGRPHRATDHTVVVAATVPHRLTQPRQPGARARILPGAPCPALGQACAKSAGAALLDWLWLGFPTGLSLLQSVPLLELQTSSWLVWLSWTKAIDSLVWYAARAGARLLDWLRLGFFTGMSSVQSVPLLELQTSSWLVSLSATKAIHSLFWYTARAGARLLDWLR